MIGELIDTVSNLEYGILAGLVLTVIMLVIIKGVNNGKHFTLLSYIIALALCAILNFQMSRLIGACHVSSMTSQMNDIVGMVSPTLSKYISSSTSHSIGWFIARRIMWILLFVGIAGLGIIKTMKTDYHGSKISYDDYDSSSSSNVNEWGI